MKFHTFITIHNHIKLLSSIVLFLITTELLNFLCDHVVISDVNGMFAERKTIMFYNGTRKVRRDLSNKTNNSPLLEVSMDSFHARI